MRSRQRKRLPEPGKGTGKMLSQSEPSHPRQNHILSENVISCQMNDLQLEAANTSAGLVGRDFEVSRRRSFIVPPDALILGLVEPAEDEELLL